MAVFYILLTILIGVLTTIYYFIRKKLSYWQERGIPHDPPHIFWGNVRGFNKDRIFQDILIELYRKYKGTGPFCGMYFFQQPSALILDTQLAKNILIKDFSNFADRGMFCNERDDPLSGHLFALDGIKWKQLRQKLSPTFTSGKMKFMFPTVVSVAEQFVKVFGEIVEKSNLVEIKDLNARFTTDVIGTCAFGIECNSLQDPNAEFRVMGRMAFQKNRHGKLLMGFIFGNPELARKLRMRQIHEDVHQFFMRIVRETVAQREQQNIKRSDFMDLLVELKNTKAIKLENGEVLTGLTVEEVAAQAFIFFLAGFETSSTAMSFALYELARHQDVQDKVRQEIHDVLAKHNQQFTYECIKDLKYLNQVLSETLRLHSIVPHLIRKALNDYVVPEHPKYVLHKGIQIIIPASSYHLDPELYPEPHAFKPERFSPEMVAQRDSVEWLPFGEGPRNCIGLRFGQMQSRIGLAFLIKNFKFSVCPETQIPLIYDPKSFVLAAEGGINLRVERV